MSTCGKTSIYNFASKDRIVDFFSLQDVTFGTHFDHRTESSYYFTSLCVLKRAGSMTSLKAYGWTEDESSITFIYRDSRTSTKLVTFPRPVLTTLVQVDLHSKKKKKVKMYSCTSNIVDNLQMHHYTPGCMYVSTDYIRNFQFLFARLCVNEDCAGVISINIHRSS